MSCRPRLSIPRLVALLPLVLLLLGGTVAAALHHHDGDADACAVCVHASTPVAGTAALPSAPLRIETSEQLAFFAAVSPVFRASTSTTTRAPPAA